MSSRSEYIEDLLRDCTDALEEIGIRPGHDEYGPLVAALILSDALNGVRKALLGPWQRN